MFSCAVLQQAIIKYILHQVHDALGHNGTANTYHCLKWLHYQKGLYKDVDTYVNQGLK